MDEDDVWRSVHRLLHDGTLPPAYEEVNVSCSRFLGELAVQPTGRQFWLAPNAYMLPGSEPDYTDYYKDVVFDKDGRAYLLDTHLLLPKGGSRRGLIPSGGALTPERVPAGIVAGGAAELGEPQGRVTRKAMLILLEQASSRPRGPGW